MLEMEKCRKVLKVASRSRCKHQPMAPTQGFQTYIVKEMNHQGRRLQRQKTQKSLAWLEDRYPGFLI